MFLMILGAAALGAFLGNMPPTKSRWIAPAIGALIACGVAVVGTSSSATEVLQIVNLWALGVGATAGYVAAWLGWC